MTASELDALVAAAQAHSRDVAHDYLPEQLRDIYTALHDTYGPELLRLRDALV